MSRHADHDCTCEGGPQFEGPAVDCDVHGLPSAAYGAGYSDGEAAASVALTNPDRDIPAWELCETAFRGDDCRVHPVHRWHGIVREGRVDPPTATETVYPTETAPGWERCGILADGYCPHMEHHWGTGGAIRIGKLPENDGNSDAGVHGPSLSPAESPWLSSDVVWERCNYSADNPCPHHARHQQMGGVRYGNRARGG